MCLEESFWFTRDALKFRQLKIYAARTAPPSSVQITLSQLLSLHRVTRYHSAQLPLVLTGTAESAQMFLWLSGRALRQQRKRLWVRFPGNTHN